MTKSFSFPVSLSLIDLNVTVPSASFWVNEVSTSYSSSTFGYMI